MALLQEYRQLKENFFIMGGHLADDLCQGALPAILAFMYVEGRLTSYADVAFLVMAATLMNAAAQPLTGLWADKRPRPYLMCLGMLTAAAGIMFTGLVESFWILCLLVAVNGLGAAVFHPAAGKLANIFAKQHVGKGMSIFSVGGNIGYALGPLYFTAGYMIFGLKATLLICLPALVMAVIFIGRNRFYTLATKRQENRVKRRAAAAALKEDYAGLTILLALVFARSAAMFSLTTFLPLYFMHELSLNEESAALTNSAVALCGAAATLIGGTFSDKYGFTRLVRLSSLLAVPFAVLFVLADNAVLALCLLIPLAMIFYTAMSPIVVLGQRYLCLHLGLATGLTVGLGITFGGIVAPALGKVGDAYGLTCVMFIIAGLFALSAVISLFLPRTSEERTAG